MKLSRNIYVMSALVALLATGIITGCYGLIRKSNEQKATGVLGLFEKGIPDDTYTVSITGVISGDSSGQSSQVISRRLDQLGLKYGKKTSGDTCNLHIYGVKDTAFIKEFIFGSFALSFCEVYPPEDVLDILALYAQQKNAETAKVPEQQMQDKRADTVDLKQEKSPELLSEVIRNEEEKIVAYEKTPTADRVQALLDKLQPAYSNTSYFAVGKPADRIWLDSFFAAPEMRSALPGNLKMMYQEMTIQKKNNLLIYAVKIPEGTFILNEENVMKAQADFDPVSSRPIITIELDEQGSWMFEKLTERNVGKPLAIATESEVLSAPLVNAPITGGRLSISGDFTAAESERLAHKIMGGSFSSRVKMVSSKVTSSGKEKSSTGLSRNAVRLVIISLAVFAISFFTTLLILRQFTSFKPVQN